MAEIKKSNNKIIEILDNEVQSDKAIIFHHGTPGDASFWQPWLDTAATFGMRAISYSRAGYGRSSRNLGRTVFSNNTDISEILDSLKISCFISIGWSGGGPHALATTCDYRNFGAICLAGVGAYGAADLNFLEGMGQENHDEFGAALLGEKSITDWLMEFASNLQSITGAEVLEAFGSLIGKADKAVLQDGYADEMAQVMRKGLALGFTGWVDDDLAFVKEWGFKLSAISKPVFLWQGDDDLMVPHAHSLWLEKNIPTAVLRSIPAQGHISIGIKYRSEILKQAHDLLRQG
jgi:pimeloyl-ACP methyl ester carboxylesterase